MEKMNIDKVAKLAHVSRSVVSRVLNNHPNVSEEARERVERVVQEYNYKPNTLARSLATNHTYQISVLTSRNGDEYMGNGYWTLLYLGIFEECTRHGYFVRLSFISPDMKEKLNDPILNGLNLDGVICLNEEVTDLVYNPVSERGIPIVLVGHNPKYPQISSVDVDNYSGVYKAMKHLIGLGHRNIGGIFGNDNVQETDHRISGYRDALAAHELPVRDDYMFIGDYSQKTGYEAMKRWITEHPEMTAVFCASDTIAMGVILLLHENNIRIPEQFSVVGFDGLPISQYTIPPLTTICQPIYRKGERAAELLINRIQNCDAGPVHESLEPDLIVRKSCSWIA
jgi:LacI family transcriptional regulator